MTLRRLTNHTAANPGDNPFAGNGSMRNCMSCFKWRPQAGGRIHPRTRLWQCHGCRPITTNKPEPIPCAS